MWSPADNAGMSPGSISGCMPNGHPSAHRSSLRPARDVGFTLLELMMALVIAGLLLAVGIPSYSAIVERQKVTQAGIDLVDIAMSIQRYRTTQFRNPESLGDLGPIDSLPKDPWGHDYQYLNFDSPAPGISGMIRKEHNLHPLNTEFDLYSLGKDGKSKAPLTAKDSRDDVIYARDGAFVGLAEDF